MKLNSALAYTVVMASFALGACAHNEKHQDQQQAQKAPPTAQEQAVSQMQMDRDSYVQRVTNKLNEYQQHTATLRQQAQSAQKPMNKKLENAAEDMDSTLKDVNTALNEVKSSAPQNWLDYKRDVEKAMNRADAQFSNSTSLLR